MKRSRIFLHKMLIKNLVTLICIIISILFLCFVRLYELERLRGSSVVELAQIRGRIEHVLAIAVSPLNAMNSLMQAEGHILQDDKFIKFTKSQHDSIPNLLALQLAPDGIVMLSSNPEQNAKAIGHDLFKDPNRREQSLRAAYNNKNIVTGPVTLIQGGDAVIVRKPIYIKGTTSRTGIKNFFGFAIAIIDIENIYRTINVDWEKYALRGRHGLGENGDVFHGNLRIFDIDNIQMTIYLPTGSWIIAKRAPVFRDYAIEIAFAALLAMFISCIIIYFSAKRRNAKTAVEKYNQCLHIASVIGKMGFIEVFDDQSFNLSSGARRILGICDKDILPENIRINLCTFQDRSSLLLKDEKLEHLTLKLYTKNGQERIIKLISPVQEMKPVIFTVIDITEEEIRRNHENNIFKMASIGKLAAGVAHELNTPLQYIADNLLYLQKSIADIISINPVLNRGSSIKLLSLEALQELNDECPAAINDCIVGVQRMSRIVYLMKCYASPANSTELQTVDIRQAILDAIELTTGTHKYISKITYDNPLQPIWVSAKQNTLPQVFINLINNSCDAIRERYEQAPNVPKGRIVIELKIKGNKLHINFSDNGGGISENISDHIFNLFFTTKSVGKGTGQGLAIVQSIIRQNNGVISYQRLPPDGSLFVIELNLSQSIVAVTEEVA